jgi:hypothetical protein
MFSGKLQELRTDADGVNKGRVSATNQVFSKVALRDVVVQNADLTAQFESCTGQLEGQITTDRVDWGVTKSIPAWFGGSERFKGQKLLAMDGTSVKRVKSAEYLLLDQGAILLITPMFEDETPPADEAKPADDAK